MIAKAHVKLQRISPRKASLVAALIRKKNVNIAMDILKNTNKKASKIFIKLLASAIANATNNFSMDGNSLFISKVLVNKGQTLKRFQPRAKGSAYPILKRTSHLTIELNDELGGK